MLLKKIDYKKFIMNNHIKLNKILKEKLNFYIEIKIINNEILLTKKSIDGIEVFTYDEYENSIEYIDWYLKTFIYTFLFTESRNIYLLDIIKRIWNVEKSENILIESIQKWYLN